MGFTRALEFVLKEEGRGCYQVPGETWVTCFGISQKHNPDLEFPLTYDEAARIYKERYWNRAGCDNLPDDWALAVFDTAVNLGVSRATRMKRESKTLLDFLSLRLAYYADLEIFDRYGRGWTRRVARLQRELSTLRPTEGRVDALVDNRGLLVRLLAAVKGISGPVRYNIRPMISKDGIKIDVDAA